MANSKKPTVRKPASKFPKLRKLIEQKKVQKNVVKNAQTRVYKSGNR
jgi:hypothetical protein